MTRIAVLVYNRIGADVLPRPAQPGARRLHAGSDRGRRELVPALAADAGQFKPDVLEQHGDCAERARAQRRGEPQLRKREGIEQKKAAPYEVRDRL